MIGAMMRKILAKPGRKVKSAAAISALFCAAITGAGLLWSHPAAASPLPAPVIVADNVSDCSRNFFGLEPWYNFMPSSEIRPKNDPNDSCGIKCFNIFTQGDKNDCGETASDVPGVLLAIVDDLLRIAGIVAIVFVIMGSFEYAGSRGNSEKAASAQSTIISALTGLAVALVAVALVSFIGNKLGG